MWPRLEITTENYRQESFDAGSTTCCKDTTGIINRASLYNQPDGLKNQPWVPLVSLFRFAPLFLFMEQVSWAQTLSDKRRK